VAYVVLGAGEQVIDAQHLPTLLDQPIAKVRAEKASPASYHDSVVHASILFFMLDGQ
jgi:hypothetical protein